MRLQRDPIANRPPSFSPKKQQLINATTRSRRNVVVFGVVTRPNNSSDDCAAASVCSAPLLGTVTTTFRHIVFHERDESLLVNSSEWKKETKKKAVNVKTGGGFSLLRCSVPVSDMPFDVSNSVAVCANVKTRRHGVQTSRFLHLIN